MKTLSVRLLDALVAEIEPESHSRDLSKSAVVRERLSTAFATPNQRPPSLEDIAHLIGSVDGLPSDLSARKKKYLTPAYLRRR